MFTLHPRLQADCLTLGRFELCRLLLMNDQQFPWFILVPELTDITEVFQLDKNQRILLAEESSYLAENMNRQFQADKINIAAIGNLVPQLHVHHVVRYRHDPVWPAPIWGKLPPVPYAPAQLQNLRAELPIWLAEIKF